MFFQNFPHKIAKICHLKIEVPLVEIDRRFAEDKPALATYNLKDCELVTQIFHKTEIMPFLLERATVNGLPVDRHGGSVAAFGHLYFPRMHRAGYVAPNLGEVPPHASPGGYVMDSRPGLYDSVLVLDYKSLYPSIIRTFLIDPVGLVEGMAQPDPEHSTEGFLDAWFSREKHCLPEIVTNIWHGRDEAKRQGNKPLSQALKIIMNAFYGVLGTTACRFFDPRLASSITMRGHQIMRQTKALIEAQGYDVIYGDTDSTFVWLKGAHSEEEAAKIGRVLVQHVNAWWAETLQKQRLTSALELEYETHFCRFLMPTIRGADTGSKKRYAGLIQEGDKQRMVFKGLETVRTDWTPLAQQFIQSTLHLDIPDDYQARLKSTAAADSVPMLRMEFTGHSVDAPLLSETARRFNVNNNIISAQMDYAGGVKFGIMLTEMHGTQEDTQAAIAWLQEHHVKVEVLGYV